MSKNLMFDASVALEFRRLVHGGPGLPALLEDRITDGEFYVWVPDEVTSVDTRRLREDIFYPASFDVDPVRMQAIGEFLTCEMNGLVIADTYHELSHPKPDWARSLEWFSFARQPGPPRLFPFLRKERYNVKTYSDLFGAASAYPTTVMLTSITDPLDLASGMDLNSHAGVLHELLDRVRQLMVGVFDERSMLVWSRSGACPE
jgi:hypothetical protein